MSKTLLGLNTDELHTLVQKYGEPAYRGNQLVEWIYRKKVHTFQEMSNLPDKLQESLSKEYEVGYPKVLAVQSSRDGTTKLLLEMGDGSRVETVGLPYTRYFSCCVSTQVGCPVACVFCATGQSGFTRNLTAGEIVGQVLTVEEVARSRQLQTSSHNHHIDHVTFMGMGEPLLNYEATIKAIKLLNSELGISMRHLTVSTVGLVPDIHKLAQEKLQITLAVSLHAPFDDLRRQLIPGMAKWRVSEIVDACHEYLIQTGRRITFEYCLLGGVNDGITEARELVRILHGLNCHVNLIPYNPVSGLTFSAPRRKRILAFREILESGGIQVTQRIQRGPDIDAACGQLRQRTL
jgi:23S rRNA (adenine2503-C2)-methyltransferase